MKGITEGMALPRLSYADINGDQPRKSLSKTIIVDEPQQEKTGPRAEPVRVAYTRSPGRSGFGADPMVSQASVIHELSYGRIYGNYSKPATGAGYSVAKGYVPCSLDIIV